MGKRKLYVMALYAMQADERDYEIIKHENAIELRRKDPAKDEDLMPPVMLYAGLSWGMSEAHARELGMAQIIEWCPPEKFWVNHHVTINSFTKGMLEKALAEIGDDFEDDEEAEEVMRIM